MPRKMDQSCWAAFDADLPVPLRPTAFDLHDERCLLDDYWVTASDTPPYQLVATATNGDLVADTADLEEYRAALPSDRWATALVITDRPYLHIRRR